MKENNIIKENFIFKIKQFFYRIIKKNKIEDTSLNSEVIDLNKTDFMDNILIKPDEEKVKWLRLQRDYKEGKILEKDMSSEERLKLIELYKTQNNSMMETLEMELNQLKTMLDDVG